LETFAAEYKLLTDGLDPSAVSVD